jgi:hypothetical protein
MSHCVFALQHWSSFSSNGVSYTLEMSKNLQKQLLSMSGHPNSSMSVSSRDSSQGQSQQRSVQSARSRYASNNRATVVNRPRPQQQQQQRFQPASNQFGYQQQHSGASQDFCGSVGSFEQPRSGSTGGLGLVGGSALLSSDFNTSAGTGDNDFRTSGEPMSSFGEHDLNSLSSSTSGKSWPYFSSISDIDHLRQGSANSGAGAGAFGEFSNGQFRGQSLPGAHSQGNFVSVPRLNQGYLQQQQQDSLFHSRSHTRSPPGLISPMTSNGNSRSTSISSLSQANDLGDGRFQRTVSDASLAYLYSQSLTSNLGSYDPHGMFPTQHRTTPGGFCGTLVVLFACFAAPGLIQCCAVFQIPAQSFAMIMIIIQGIILTLTTAISPVPGRSTALFEVMLCLTNRFLGAWICISTCQQHKTNIGLNR